MITKGQIIKVAVTGVRFRLERITKMRSELLYQFYPVEKADPIQHIYPFKISEKHFKQFVSKEHMIIEPME